MFVGCPPRPAGLRVVDETDRVRRARILGERRIIQVQRARLGIEDHVLEDRAEPARRRVDLWLGLGGELDHLRVTAAFEIEDAAVAPAMLVISDQAPLRIARQGGLPRTRQAKEERGITVLCRRSPSSASA